MEKEYTDSRELFEDTWKYLSVKQKKKLLVANGVSPSFAVTKSPQEMIDRGGGLGVKQLGRMFDLYLKSKGGKVRIDWATQRGLA